VVIKPFQQIQFAFAGTVFQLAMGMTLRFTVSPTLLLIVQMEQVQHCERRIEIEDHFFTGGLTIT
jgi:hypothetical protein